MTTDPNPPQGFWFWVRHLVHQGMLPPPHRFQNNTLMHTKYFLNFPLRCTGGSRSFQAYCKPSWNLPAVLCFYDFAMIQTEHAHVPTISLCRGDVTESVRRLFLTGNRFRYRAIYVSYHVQFTYPRSWNLHYGHSLCSRLQFFHLWNLDFFAIWMVSIKVKMFTKVL